MTLAETHLFGGRHADTRWPGWRKTKAGCLLQKRQEMEQHGGRRDLLGLGWGFFLNLLFHYILKKKKKKASFPNKHQVGSRGQYHC